MAVDPNLSPAPQEDELFAVIDGEAIPLDGHLQRGVVTVLHEVAKLRGYEFASLTKPVELIRSKDEAI